MKFGLCAGLALGASLLAGCQSYTAKPLDLPAHETAWKSRSPSAGHVVAYAKKLESLGLESAIKYDPSDGLSLSEAEVVALFFNPQLRSARLRAKVPLVGAKEAGRWEDPVLAIDGERVVHSVSQPWVLFGSLGFTVPLSGRLGAEKRLAFSQADAELLKALAEEIRIATELRAKWLEWSATQQRIDLTSAYLKELDEIVARAEKLRAAGELDRLDARLFRIERVTRSGELQTLKVEQREQELALKALMGLTPDATVQLHPVLTMVPDAASPEQRRRNLEETPRLKLAKAEYQAAEHTLDLEVRRQYPDLSIGGGYGKDQGEARWPFSLSLPIPLLNANRRGIAEARMSRDVARANVEGIYEELIGDLARLQVSLEAAQTRRKLLETELAPLVDEQVADTRKLGRLGDFTTLISLEAYTKSFETKLQVLEAKLKEASVANQLNALLRPGLPDPAVTTEKK